MAAQNVINREMQSNAARYNTFRAPQQVNKRRASAQANNSKKRGGSTVEWPHARPSVEELSRAGFFYRPDLDTPDNVQCFFCGVRLDGWEPTDDPLQEHINHSPTCSWAISQRAGSAAVGRHADASYDGARDPMSDELAAARDATFANWPHDGKRGWKCKISKMADAGWCFDPAPTAAAEAEEEENDGVTCFYCELSLDGWEPKDDPFEEHKRRMPDCQFFALLERFGTGPGAKRAKGQGKKAAARTSTASKASSRLSVQSALSTVSQDLAIEDVQAGVEDLEAQGAAIDDSIMSTASQATTTGTKGRKKGGRAKAPAKAVKGRKRANNVEPEEDAGPVYPNLGSQNQPLVDAEDVRADMVVSEPIEDVVPAPSKKSRKGTQPSKQPQVDSSVMEISSMEAVSQPKKATRARKLKVQKAETPPSPEEPAENSEASAQLQEELERSVDLEAELDLDQSTPQVEAASRPKRGVKRTSEGLRKKNQDFESDVSAVLTEFPVPPKPATAVKGKGGRKASKQVAAAEVSHVEILSQPTVASHDDVTMSEAEAPITKPVKSKKMPAAKAKPRGKKASSVRSSRSSKATVITSEQEPHGFEPEEEDLERDEREIEAELERIAAEQAVLQAEQEKAVEFEPSPSHHASQIQGDISEGRRASSQRESAKAAPSPPPQLPPLDLFSQNATPSPAGSDKENQPSASIPATKQNIMISPTKTTTIRIPLAPGTPNRCATKHPHLSPSKALGRIHSTVPWEAIDLDTVLLASPQPTPRTLAARLVHAAGALTSPEKSLTVEGWVQWRAERAEAELRRRGEEMVGAFEREGLRAVGVLGGVVVG